MNSSRRTCLILLCGLLAPPAATASDLRPHPRLLATDDDLAAVASRAERDPLLATVRDVALASAERMGSRRTCEHRIPDGKRLLAESRQAIDTVLHTAMAWRLTGDRRHFDRCVKELDAACGLPDWNPSHFLDTAEMATAVAIGLDWLHRDLADEQRSRYREAILEKALAPARREFDRKTSWTRISNNWSQVCGAGIALACLATATDAADLAASPWEECLGVARASSRFYEPDGCYPEGPGYWDYGTSYHVLALAMLETIGRAEPAPRPLLRSVAFMAHARGPTGTMFNFADSGPFADTVVAARGWLAGRAADPALVTDVRRGLATITGSPTPRRGHDRFFPLHLLWLPPEPERPASLPLADAFHGQQPMAAFRTSWSDPAAVYVAVKGGTPQASHGHMDVGSFVVEAAGRRWIHDLGSDDYNLPGYFGGQRWDYFRLNSRSHNVPAIDGGLQNPACRPCAVEAATNRPPFSARIDLGPAYVLPDRRLAAGVIREVSLDPESRVIRVRDTVTDAVGPVRWQVLVDVEPAIDGHCARLGAGGHGIELRMRGTPAGVEPAWQVEAARPPTPREKPNDGFRLLSFTTAGGPEVVIDVEIREWAAAGPRR